MAWFFFLLFVLLLLVDFLFQNICIWMCSFLVLNEKKKNQKKTGQGTFKLPVFQFISNTITWGKLVIKCPRKPREIWGSAEGVSPRDFHEVPEAWGDIQSLIPLHVTVLVCNAMITDEIYLVSFEILSGMLILFMLGTSTCTKWVVQCLCLKVLFDIRSCILMREN